MNLAKYSLDNTKVIYFFLAVLLIGGVFSFGKLGKKEDAPFVIKSAVIMTRYPGAEPAEVERHFQNHIRTAPFATRLFHPSEMG